MPDDAAGSPGAVDPAAAPAAGAREVPGAIALLSNAPMGSFDETGAYVPRLIVEDDLGGTSLEEAIDATIVEFDDGDIVEGSVVKIDKDEVLLDIGFKSEGVIPSRELSIRNDIDPSEIVSLGDRIEALVLQKEDKEGRLVLSKKRAQYERAWGTIEKIKESDGVVKGPVIEVVKGGLIVDIGLRGFLPASLVELRRVRELQPYVGRSIEAKIIELDRNRNNVVLSRRAWLKETQKEQRGEFLLNLKPGERRRGVVSSVVNFGAFVDLGGMDGLIHVSELSWKHVDHPSSVRVGGRRGRGRGARRRPRQRTHQPVAQGHADRSAGRTSPTPTRWASSSTGASPSSCPSAPSSRWATASRAWCTSRRWPGTAWTSPSRWSPPARSCGSRSSTSTCNGAASACSINRPPKVAKSPRNTARPSGARYDAGQLHRLRLQGSEFTPETEAQAAWAEEFATEHGVAPDNAAAAAAGAAHPDGPAASAEPAPATVDEAPAGTNAPTGDDAPTG